MNKNRIMIVSGVTLTLILIIFFNLIRKTGEEEIICAVKKGAIEVKVHTSGQLEAEKSENRKRLI